MKSAEQERQRTVRIDENHVPVHPHVVDGGHTSFKAVMRALVCGALLVLLACSNQGARLERPGASVEADTMLADLLSHLPTGASACALAQPRWVEPTRRPLMVPLTTLDRLVWRDSPTIEAYAQAQQRDRMGPGAIVRLIRFRGDVATLRSELSRDVSFDVRWDVAPSECVPDHCIVSARLVAPNVARLERGTWHTRAAGEELQCAALAREHPKAAELSIRGQAEMAFSGGLVPLIASTTRIEVGARRVQLVQADQMDSLEAAQVLAEANVELIQGRMGSLGVTTRRQRDNVVISTTDLTWDDLQLGIDDRKRETGNHRYAELLLALEPDDAVDPRQRDHALEQLRLRVALLEHAPVSESILRSSVALAERLYAQFPDDADSAYLLARIYVKHARQPERAQPLVDRFAPTDLLSARWSDLGLPLPTPR